MTSLSLRLPDDFIELFNDPDFRLNLLVELPNGCTISPFKSEWNLSDAGSAQKVNEPRGKVSSMHMNPYLISFSWRPSQTVTPTQSAVILLSEISDSRSVATA